MRHKVYVVMATFNGEKYIKEQLGSIAKQSFVPDLVIIQDDVSSDNTLSIIEDFSDGCSFLIDVKVNEENIGYRNNFLRAIGRLLKLQPKADDLIFFCDQDDHWFREKIERVVGEFVKDSSLLAVTHDVEFTDSELVPQKVSKLELFENQGIDSERYVMGAASAVRCDFVAAMWVPSLSSCSHDDWFVGSASAMGSRKILHQNLAYYRRHDGNASFQSFNRNTERRVCRIANARELIAKSNLNLLGLFSDLTRFDDNMLGGLLALPGLKEGYAVAFHRAVIGRRELLAVRIGIRESIRPLRVLLVIWHFLSNKNYSLRHAVSDVVS